jgi:hypothetical protein
VPRLGYVICGNQCDIIIILADREVDGFFFIQLMVFDVDAVNGISCVFRVG